MTGEKQIVSKSFSFAFACFERRLIGYERFPHLQTDGWFNGLIEATGKGIARWKTEFMQIVHRLWNLVVSIEDLDC